MPRSQQFRTVFYLLLVFASGILVGAVSTRLYAVKASVPAAAAPPRTMAELRARYTAELRQNVPGVTDAQAAAVAKILDDTKKKYDDVRRGERPVRDRIQQEQIDAIRAVLTNAQKPAYEAWRLDRLREAQQKERPRTGAASGASRSSQ